MNRLVAHTAVVLAGIPAMAGVPTFTRDVAPILYKHCAGCHHANDIAPMPLLTYKEVRPWTASIREAVVLRRMPPWKADPHVGKWSNDPSLSATEVATITAWIDGGKLQGDPKDLPPAPVFAEGWHGGPPDKIIKIPTFTLTDKGPDEYKYFDVPTNFTEDMWIVSAELRPGNRKIVHHAHVFVVEPQKPAAAKSKSDPATEYSKWLHVNEGSLVFIRPTAPVIND
ncbi:MAG: hypothetical protein M3Z32_01360, partial [Acidobacteriota bacterium]|nr:hypothetical protein [Acidobacteriota bacterium]